MSKKCEYPCDRSVEEGEQYCYIHKPRESEHYETPSVRGRRDAQHLHEKAGLALSEYGVGEAAFSDPTLAVMLARVLFMGEDLSEK